MKNNKIPTLADALKNKNEEFSIVDEFLENLNNKLLENGTDYSNVPLALIQELIEKSVKKENLDSVFQKIDDYLKKQ